MHGKEKREREKAVHGNPFGGLPHHIRVCMSDREPFRINECEKKETRSVCVVYEPRVKE